MFPSFGEFLRQLAARSPDIMIGYLQKDEEALLNFYAWYFGRTGGEFTP
jgi:hypothetical protein